MAKKKNSNQEKPVTHQEKSMEPPTEDQSEAVKNLKTLNQMLMKETLEKRGQIESLVKSKTDLELEIEKLKKQGFVDLSIEAEIRKDVTKDFVEERIDLEKEGMCRERDEMRGLLEEKCEEIESVGKDFERFREEIGKEVELKKEEVDRLRSEIRDLEKKSGEAEKEIDRIRLERDEVLGIRSELEKRIEDLKLEMADVVKQKGEIQELNVEKDGKIKELWKSLDGVNAEIESVKGSLAGVVSEKEVIQKKFDGKVEEVERLKMQVNELETCNVATEEELGKLRSERRRVLDERMEIEGKLELVVKKLLESSKLVAKLKGDIDHLSVEKEEGERERSKFSTEIAGYVKQVEELQTNVSTLQGKESDLLGKVTVLSDNNAVALHKQEQLQLEINKLKGEKSDIEKKIEVLVAENSSTLRNLQDTILLLEAEKQKVSEISHDKADIEKVKGDQLDQIAVLGEQVSTLKALVSSLEEASLKQGDTITAVKSEATQYKDALEGVTAERENFKKEVELKKKEEERLRLEVLESEKRNKVTTDELEAVRVLKLTLSDEIEEMKICIDTLTGQKGELERKLVKAEGGFSELEAKMKSSQMHTNNALEMLKNTMKQLEEAGTDNAEELNINGGLVAEELQPFVAELEAIKKSFKGKSGEVEEMNKRFETLQCSVSDAQKKRNFWAWLSSATTLLAAVSMAYIARGR